MKTTLEQRLASLESEHQTGRKMMAELDEKRARLTETLLRIEGAMEVLRELLAKEPGENKP